VKRVVVLFVVLGAMVAAGLALLLARPWERWGSGSALGEARAYAAKGNWPKALRAYRRAAGARPSPELKAEIDKLLASETALLPEACGFVLCLDVDALKQAGLDRKLYDLASAAKPFPGMLEPPVAILKKLLEHHTYAQIAYGEDERHGVDVWPVLRGDYAGKEEEIAAAFGALGLRLRRSPEFLGVRAFEGEHGEFTLAFLDDHTLTLGHPRMVRGLLAARLGGGSPSAWDAKRVRDMVEQLAEASDSAIACGAFSASERMKSRIAYAMEKLERSSPEERNSVGAHLSRIAFHSSALHGSLMDDRGGLACTVSARPYTDETVGLVAESASALLGALRRDLKVLFTEIVQSMDGREPPRRFVREPHLTLLRTVDAAIERASISREGGLVTARSQVTQAELDDLLKAWKEAVGVGGLGGEEERPMPPPRPRPTTKKWAPPTTRVAPGTAVEAPREWPRATTARRAVPGTAAPAPRE
jgi:hypothetical protein